MLLSAKKLCSSNQIQLMSAICNMKALPTFLYINEQQPTRIFIPICMIPNIKGWIVKTVTAEQIMTPIAYKYASSLETVLPSVKNLIKYPSNNGCATLKQYNEQF